MSDQQKKLLIFIAVQVIAIIVYPPSFFASSPQAIIAPPALLILMLVTLITLNSKAISPENGRNALAFIQGINITIRLLMLLPNLYDAEGNLHLILFVTQLVGIGISWYAISSLAKWRSTQLRFTNQEFQEK